jgi:hypothetical protein
LRRKLKKALTGGGAVVVVCDALTGRGDVNTSTIVFASGIGDPPAGCRPLAASPCPHHGRHVA